MAGVAEQERLTGLSDNRAHPVQMGGCVYAQNEGAMRRMKALQDPHAEQAESLRPPFQCELSEEASGMKREEAALRLELNDSGAGGPATHEPELLSELARLSAHMHESEAVGE